MSPTKHLRIKAERQMHAQEVQDLADTIARLENDADAVLRAEIEQLKANNADRWAKYLACKRENRELRQLLQEAAPKCDECDAIAIWEYNDISDPPRYLSCAVHMEHKRWQPHSLGCRIKAALEKEQ